MTHLLNSSQAIVNSEATDAWGNVVASSYGVADRHGFTGRERDGESALMHYRARSHDPRIGRFVQPDPLLELQIEQHYVYVLNNPLALTDPFGLHPMGNGGCVPHAEGGGGDEKAGSDDVPAAPQCVAALHCRPLSWFRDAPWWIAWLIPDHCLFVIRDCDGNEWTLDGQPDGGISGGVIGGTLIAQLQAGFPTKPGGGSDLAPEELVRLWVDDCDGDDICECFIGAAGRLDGTAGYRLFTLNSNTFIAAILLMCDKNGANVIKMMPGAAWGANQNSARTLIQASRRR